MGILLFILIIFLIVRGSSICFAFVIKSGSLKLLIILLTIIAILACFAANL